jgi:hypothetical protein
MGDIKPLGSEKLSGDEKLKRILELTYYNNQKKTNSNNKSEIVKESVTNGVYGIVKEKDGYYVKKGLNENTLDYIGGMFMKNKNKFSSYAEALKRMDLLVGQESLQEATKYVLKQKTNKEESPTPEQTMDAPPPPPSPEMGTTDTPSDMGSMDASSNMGATDTPSDMGSIDTPPSDGSSPESTDDTKPGDMNGKRSDYMAEIQKFAGKLGQQLRDEHEKMESDDIKYVLNMIISAVDLDKLEDDDIEEIGKKFNRDEDEETPSEEPSSDEETPSEEPEPSPEPTPDEDLGETMSKLDSFIRTSAPHDQDEIDLSKYADLGNVDEDLQEIDLDEIKNEINKSIGDTLSKYFK